jgi:hypothetical protein
MVFIFVIFLAFATCIDFSSGPPGFSKYTGILNLEFQVFGILYLRRVILGSLERLVMSCHLRWHNPIR